jgi:chemotaxis protein MotB
VNDLDPLQSGRSPLTAAERLEQFTTALAHVDDHAAPTPRDDSEMDAWLLTFLDTITEVLAIFVFMVSIMQMPQPQREKFESAVRRTMQIPQVLDLRKLTIETEAPTDLPDAGNLLRTIKEHGLENEIKISITKNHATMVIGETLLFASGDDTLSPRGTDVLRSLGAPLNAMNGRITIEGHTDDRPIETARFKSNWDLSAARAISVVQLMTSLNIPQSRLRVVAYADTLPIADNAVPEGRATNRRVTISVELRGDRTDIQRNGSDTEIGDRTN